jgi:hypothetical protein
MLLMVNGDTIEGIVLLTLSAVAIEALTLDSLEMDSDTVVFADELTRGLVSEFTTAGLLLVVLSKEVFIFLAEEGPEKLLPENVSVLIGDFDVDDASNTDTDEAVEVKLVPLANADAIPMEVTYDERELSTLLLFMGVILSVALFKFTLVLIGTDGVMLLTLLIGCRLLAFVNKCDVSWLLDILPYTGVVLALSELS